MRKFCPPARFVRVVSVATCAALLMAGSAQAQTTYRWVGKDGRVHYSDQPPPPADVKDVQLKKLKGINVIDTGGAFSYETEQAAKNYPLTLYTSENCTEHCKKARDLLGRRGAPYIEKVVRTEQDAAEYRSATGGQELIVPLLMAGKRVEKGYEEDAWNRLLDGAGYPAQGNAKAGAKAAAPAKPAAVTP